MATARLVPSMAFAPSLDLLGVPSRAIMRKIDAALIEGIHFEQFIIDRGR